MILPEVLILSTQRSGTHLLESFLKSHPKINGRGELFLRLERTGKIEDNQLGKINVGIIMYNQMNIFKDLNGKLINHKIIHLIRDAHDVALSRLQMKADKNVMGSSYKAHYHQSDLRNEVVESLIRGVPDITELDRLKTNIKTEQNTHIKLLKNINHLKLNYEDFVIGNHTVEYLNPIIENQLLEFLDLKSEPIRLSTKYIKTGINHKSNKMIE